MKSVLYALLVLTWPAAAIAQTECVGIDNDIARLACFDTAFADAAPAQALRPVDAFTELSSILNSNTTDARGNPIIVHTAFNDFLCGVVITRAGVDTFPAIGSSSGRAGYLNMVAFNAADLSSLEIGWNGTVIRMRRGAEILSHRQRSEPMANGPALNDATQWFAIEYIRDGLAALAPSMERGFSAELDLLTPESSVDQQRIFGALENLAAACRAVE